MDEGVELDTVLAKLRHTQIEIARLELQATEWRDRAVALMGNRAEYKVNIDGKQLRVSKVEPKRRRYNAPRLEWLLKDKPDLLDRLTSRVVVADEFERAVRTGEIGPDIVVEVFKEIPTTPYLRFADPESK
jgi:ATP:corrinoid adenosyltransferase